MLLSACSAVLSREGIPFSGGSGEGCGGAPAGAVGAGGIPGGGDIVGDGDPPRLGEAGIPKLGVIVEVGGTPTGIAG